MTAYASSGGSRSVDRAARALREQGAELAPRTGGDGRRTPPALREALRLASRAERRKPTDADAPTNSVLPGRMPAVDLRQLNIFADSETGDAAA